MIYFVISQNRFVKIGYTSNIEKRIQELQTSQPFELRIGCVLPGLYQTEKELHKLFESFRCKGGGTEWFRYDGFLKACIMANLNAERKHKEIKTIKEFLENGTHLQCRQKLNRIKKKKNKSNRSLNFRNKIERIVNDTGVIASVKDNNK